jgi:rod shape-determining protein MreC
LSLRDGPLADLKASLIWTTSIAVIIAIVLAVAILMGDRRQTLQTQAYSATKDAVSTVAAPVGGVLSAPVRWTGGGLNAIRGYFFAVSQNDRLRAENIQLMHDRDEAIALRNENARLRTLLGMRTDPPIPHVSGWTILDARGPFANTRLIDVGSEQGVEVGNPAISEHGVIGRVVGVTKGASRILLLTDISSRTPVLIARSNARAILTGDGGPNPKLAYLRGQDPVKDGDRILTSGDGGLFPRGLPVGVAVIGLDGAWRVRLDSDFAPIDFVQVLQFKGFQQLVDQKALADNAVPPLPPDQAQAIKALEQATPPAAGVASASPPTAAPGATHAPAPAAGDHPRKPPAHPPVSHNQAEHRPPAPALAKREPTP